MAAHTISLSTHASQFNCRRPKLSSPPPSQNLSPKSSHSPWLGHTNPSLQSSHLRTPRPKHRSINATVTLSLPTANPERFSTTEKVPKWSAKALRAYGFARLEAMKMWDTDTRTCYLVTGILLDGTSLGAKFLLANGITISKLREEILKAIGRRELREVPIGFPPLDTSTQRVLDWAADEKLKSGESGEITTAHILAGVWSEKESVGHKILATLGFNEEKAKELNALISIPCVED
ncbi:ATP-dependent Clp protease ATP-binding subunit like [Actinidia chinensis var. chinensis]|uniref:ATP-dependent Clp protease ATP-binding subunit like n=1 Tax=Actinidia chinensis var. chinensis TaxID=1590841 RepID=A0A2R6QK19_ACTCC|nr:ATP-dependent Clp protease ATP-binding subunit like [Actinidia chinensis var. chinensis]